MNIFEMYLLQKWINIDIWLLWLGNIMEKEILLFENWFLYMILKICYFFCRKNM